MAVRENMNADAADRLPEQEIIAQITYVFLSALWAHDNYRLLSNLNICRTFTFAGTDTTSNAVARILHLLCLHPEVQDKLRTELLEARSRNDGHDLEYDELVNLPYLDAVCRETLRL